MGAFRQGIKLFLRTMGRAPREEMLWMEAGTTDTFINFTYQDMRELYANVGFHHVSSSAIIDLKGGKFLRGIMNRYASAWPIREFLSGTILVWAEK